MSETDERTGLEPRPFVPANGTIDEEEPPGKPRRHPLWRNVPDHLWDDWRWQSQHAIRSVRQLRDLLSFTPQELEAIGSLETEYKTAIPPYYFSLIDPADANDPIRLQSVPSPLETENPSGYELEDPLEEDKDAPVPGLTHRYPDRALLVTTHVCTMYCRFCTRKRATMVRGGWDAVSRNDERMIEYVRDHPEIRDVIVSGGDPLTLPQTKLKFFLDGLAAIPHVDVIRIGTRVPVTLPQKLYDQGLIDLLASAEKVWIQTHFNHPREVTPEAARVCQALLRGGMPVNNHTVLMKGVNDSLETMRELMRALLRIKVRPYYIFHCDPVIGAGHFRTSVWKGMEIMEGFTRPHVRIGHSDLRRRQSARRRQDPGDAELPCVGIGRCGRLTQLRRHAGSLPGRGQADHGEGRGVARRQCAAAGREERTDSGEQRTHGAAATQPRHGRAAAGPRRTSGRDERPQQRLLQRQRPRAPRGDSVAQGAGEWVRIMRDFTSRKRKRRFCVSVAYASGS
jgi:lysine 2,3-aminomutase